MREIVMDMDMDMDNGMPSRGVSWEVADTGGGLRRGHGSDDTRAAIRLPPAFHILLSIPKTHIIIM